MSLAPEANSEARAPEAIKSSARPRLAMTDCRTAPFDAVVLDHLNVGARAGFLDAEEHGAPKTEHHDN